MYLKVNSDISLTHLLSRKKQTLIASLGVGVAIGVFIFMISLVIGFNRKSDESLFKSVSHIRIYQDDEISKPLLKEIKEKFISVIINPKISNISKSIINPNKLILDLKKQNDIVTVTPQVAVNLFYNNGKSQLNGISSGLNIIDANKMFDIQSTIIAGNIKDLLSLSNGIIIGVGIANKLNIQLNDNISVTSSIGVIKTMKVVAIFKTSNSGIDLTKSYITLSTAQQLVRNSSSYVTDILVNIKNPDLAPKYVKSLSELTGYKAEDWQSANEQVMATKATRQVLLGSMSMAVLLVASFGIYNIINMTIKEKINDIAILKATGFSGKDVINIFIKESIIMGFIGSVLGLSLASIVINFVSGIYVGGDMGNFPIRFEKEIFIIGFFLGIFITIVAGYIPAKSAANIDPIAIFRK
jgi:lipoprotein-releasing system permease protein